MFKAIRQLFKKEKKVEVLPEYQKWRDGIFTVTSEQAGVSRDESDRVYGVIMDVGLANDDGTSGDKNLVITETAFASGESSLQTSFGGGIIGLGSNQEISEQVQEIIRLAQLLIKTTTPANNQDLPESGKVYFYLLTTSGIKFYECGLREVQAEAHPFGELFSRFSVIKGRADQLMAQYSKKSGPRLNAVYIVIFTQENLNPKLLEPVAEAAANMAIKNDSAFKQLMEKYVEPKTRMEIAHTQYDHNKHTLETLQSSMRDWLKHQFNLTIKPILGQNFFAYQTNDTPGKESFTLFYFDFEE